MIPSEFERVLKELLTHKRRLALVIFSGMAVALIDSASPPLLKAIFDRFQKGEMDLVQDSFLALLLLAILKAPARYLHFYNMNVVSEMVSMSFRKKLQSKFMTLSLNFHNNYAHGSGGLISRVLNDIVVIQHGLRMFADFFREPILFVALMGWLFYIDWKLTCFVILVLPPILIFLRQVSRSLRKYGTHGQENLEQIAGTIKESLDGVRIIQSFNLESEMEKRFEQDSNRFLGSRKKFLRYLEAASPISELVVTMVVLSILGYIGLQISKGNATYGDFIGYVAALLMLSAPMKKLQESYVRIQETMVAAKRVFTLLDDQNVIPASTAAKPFPKNWRTIEFKNVSFTYGRKPILKSVNLTITRGESIAFVGESGSGKSTTVNLLQRFFDPTEGDVMIDGTPIQEFDLKDLRFQIAMVTQDVFLFSDTIERNIWSGDFTKSVTGVEPAARSANAHDFISKMPHGYQTRVGDRGNLLSGGEKQRISIARAFFKDAPILILDEATSSLDSVSEVEVQKGLEHLMEGRTTFVIAHRLSTVQKASRICVVKDGQIVQSGTHEELIAVPGEYSRLFTLQGHSPNPDVR